MNRSARLIERPVQLQDTLELMRLQARISCIVGTHIGSPLRLMPIDRLGVDVVHPQTVNSILSRTNKPVRLLSTLLKDELPESSFKPLRAKVTEVNVSAAEKGSNVFIKFDRSVFKDDVRAINDSIIEHVDGVSPKPLNYAIKLATIDQEHAEPVLDALENSLLQRETFFELGEIAFKLSGQFQKYAG